MAWTKTSSTNPGGGYLVATETLTFPSAASTATNSSTIDFIPPGKGFTVFTNTGVVNTNSDGDVDIQVSFDGTTFVTLVEADASFDNAAGVFVYDPVNNSSHGAAPYYRLQCTHDGNQSAESFGVAIVCDGGSRVKVDVR